MKKIHFLLLICTMLFYSLTAQQESLPHMRTEGEEKVMQEYLDFLKSRSGQVPSPPPGKVRTMAEWEPIQALIITWAGQSTILREIVRHSVKECKVLIVTDNPGSVSASLTGQGISLDSVRFIDTPFNSIWVRDYGPWTVYQNDVDSLLLVDWIYNRPRPSDDAVPAGIADYLALPIYEAIIDPDDFIHTGGNHLPDGMGTAFSSTLVREENPDKSEAEIDSIVKSYLGVHNYIKFPTLPFDGIHHLDMHMRIIDEETIIFGEYPEGIADGPQINANIEYLQEEFTTSFGNKYNIIRMPMPPENNRFPDQGGDYRTYTNSVFVNKTLLVPTYEEKYDTTALRIYRENLPGYNVVGINCNSIIPSLGAIHCITKLVGVDQPLLIAHPRLRDTQETEQDYPVVAYIKHISGIAGAELLFRLKGDSLYTAIPMYLVDTLNNTWFAAIPAQLPGTEIQYYIHAVAHNGKEQVRPIVAPEGYFYFRIQGDPVNQLPTINITHPLDGAVFPLNAEHVSIEMEANDPDGSIENITLYINGDSINVIGAFPYEYSWTFSGEGQFEIIAGAKDNQGAISLSEPVHIQVENTTALERHAESGFEIFPNPVETILWVKNGRYFTPYISITNLFGQTLSIPEITDSNLTGYDFTGFPPGIYFIRYNIGGIWKTSRVIKI